MGWRPTLVRLLCLALMVSAVLWPLHGHAGVASDGATAAHVRKHDCCKSDHSQKPADSDKRDDCCKSCTFGACCMRLMVAERPVLWVASEGAIEVPGVLGSIVLTGLVQLEDIFHPPRA
jgi:hypothetical protein